MNRSEWTIVVALLLSLLSGTHVTGADAKEQSGSKLHPVFSDDFSENSLSDYEVKGEPAWEEGLVKLPQGVSLSRPVQLDARVVVTAELQFPKLTKDGEQSLTMLGIELDGATPCHVAWQQTLKDGKTSSRLFILDTVPKNGKATLQVVRSVALDGPLVSSAWSIDYRHGLLRIGRPDETVLIGYISNGAAMVGRIGWLASRAGVRLRSLAVDGLGRPHPLTESQLTAVANAAKARVQLVQLYEQGKFTDAAQLGQTILEIRRKALGERHSDYAKSLNDLAGMYQFLGEYSKAEPLFLEARDICKQVVGEDHPHYAASLINLAGLYTSQGEYLKAEPLYLEGRKITKRVLGLKHPSYILCVNNLAMLYYSQRKYLEAKPLYV